MKKKYLVIFSILIVAITALAGCTDKKSGPGGPEYELQSEKAQESGHLDNPEWDGASTTEITYDYSHNGSIVTSVVATLTWTDDHSGSDSNDIKDIFSLKISAGSGTISQESDSGNIQLKLEGNGTSEEEPGFGETASVTVACIQCGTYNSPPFIGPFLRYWDTGNDFSLTVDYEYLGPVGDYEADVEE